MNTLFDMSSLEQKKEIKPLFPHNKCRQCKHFARLNPYSERYSYCLIKPCKRTPYGVKKVKPMDPACDAFKLESK